MPNFMDEPTVGLDVIARDEVLNMLREYMEENESSSILISSHISSDLESLCDDFYMIHAGKIILHEDTDVLLSDYAFPKVIAARMEKIKNAASPIRTATYMDVLSTLPFFCL